MNNTELAQPLGWDDCQNLLENTEEIGDALERVAGLDFEMLKNKLGKEKGWSTEYLNEVEDLYRRFLALNLVYKNQKICPTGPIDDFWHAHILDTIAYERDCKQIFGKYLHHFPYFGMRGSTDRKDLERTFEKSRSLFIKHYGIDPCSGEAQARGCSPQNCP